jgi:hypothetical protein
MPPNQKPVRRLSDITPARPSSARPAAPKVNPVKTAQPAAALVAASPAADREIPPQIAKPKRRWLRRFLVGLLILGVLGVMAFLYFSFVIQKAF